MDEKRPRGRPVAPVKLHKRTVSFPPSLYDWLRERAEREERDVNDLIVSVLREDRERERDAAQPA